jgi:hypothetical protein
MSRLDELPPDQRAALSLLLRQRKSYGEVAVLLGIGAGAVHDRAHAALAMLAPRQARGLSTEQREQIADYMLGQQASIAERLATRTMLGSNPPAREWAQALAGELSAIPGATLPDVPAAAAVDVGAPAAATAASAAPPRAAVAAPQRTAVAAPPPPAAATLADAVVAAPSETQPPSSRLGGALLLGAIAIAAVVAVILITSGGKGSGHKTTTTTSSTKSSTTATAPGKVVATLAMTSPSPTSRSRGAAEVFTDGNTRVFAIIATNLPATKGFYYALWLYNSHTSSVPLAQAPAVGSSHKLEAAGALPTYAREYHQVLLTRETAAKPTHPGRVILRGTLALKE